MPNLITALKLYDPDATFVIIEDPSWDQFGERAPGDWSGTLPAPTQAQVLATMDGRNLLTITDWYRYGRDVEKETVGIRYNSSFMKQRRKIKELMEAIGYENLTLQEKEICIELFIAPTNELEALKATDPKKLSKNSKKYRELSVSARQSNQFRAELLIFNMVEGPGYLQILGAVDPKLLTQYYNLNILGIANQDAVEGVLDFVLSTPGTSFENNGLVELPFTPIGITKTELRDAIADIYQEP